jgi:hypothetical protein
VVDEARRQLLEAESRLLQCTMGAVSPAVTPLKRLSLKPNSRSSATAPIG